MKKRTNLELPGFGGTGGWGGNDTGSSDQWPRSPDFVPSDIGHERHKQRGDGSAKLTWMLQAHHMLCDSPENLRRDRTPP